MFARVLLWIHIWDLFIHVHDSFDSIHFGVLVLVYFVHSQHIHTTACSFSHKYSRLMSSEEVHLFFPTNVSTTSCFFHERDILYMWAMCGKDVLKSYRYWNNRVCFLPLRPHALRYYALFYYKNMHFNFIPWRSHKRAGQLSHGNCFKLIYAQWASLWCGNFSYFNWYSLICVLTLLSGKW